METTGYDNKSAYYLTEYQEKSKHYLSKLARDEIISEICCDTATYQLFNKYLLNNNNVFMNENIDAGQIDYKDFPFTVSTEYELSDSEITEIELKYKESLDQYNKLCEKQVSLLNRRKLTIDSLQEILISLENELKDTNYELELYDQQLHNFHTDNY